MTDSGVGWGVREMPDAMIWFYVAAACFIRCGAMNRDSLQRVSTERRREAAVLLKAGLFAGAYYLAGYSIECALKACIAKQTNRFDFPNRRLANASWTHDLVDLAETAGLAQGLAAAAASTPTFALNWSIVKDWSASARYDSTITKRQARQLYFACTARKVGVLTWIRQRW